MSKRKALSKRQRFETFKRDSFTCQYCGEQAPDVILNVDHIIPVSKGGTNKASNLITSCQSCNSGKSDKLLSDDAIVKKQMNQAKLIQERAAQIKMVAEWIKSQSGHQEIIELENSIKELSAHTLTDHGKKYFSKLIKKYGFAEVLKGIYSSYERNSRDEYLEAKSVEKCIKYNNASEDERHWMYSVGIARNRFGRQYKPHILAMNLKQAQSYGMSKEYFREIATDSDSFDYLIDLIEEYCNVKRYINES